MMGLDFLLKSLNIDPEQIKAQCVEIVNALQATQAHMQQVNAKCDYLMRSNNALMEQNAEILSLLKEHGIKRAVKKPLTIEGKSNVQ